MKVKSNFTCPGCSATTPITLFKPKHFTPSIVKITCSGCLSKFIGRFTRGKDLLPTQFNMEIEPVEISERLKAIIVDKERVGVPTNG